jgi:hypothetical protein
VGDGREVTAVLDGRTDEPLASRVLEAAADAAPGERINDAVAEVAEIAAMDPDGTLEALRALRADAEAMEGLEQGLDLSPERATLALGGAIQLAIGEMASEDPDLSSRAAELVRWLEGSW